MNTSLTFVAQGIGALLAAVTLLLLFAGRSSRALCERLGFPANFPYIAGVVGLPAAVFLVEPPAQIWGAFLAGWLLFLVGVKLLENRRYALALIDVVILIALIPVTVGAVVAL